jgi:hypothetical protein
MKGLLAILYLAASAPASMDALPFTGSGELSGLISRVLAEGPLVEETCGTEDVVLRASLQVDPSGEIDDIVIVGPDCATHYADALIEAFKRVPASAYRKVDEPTYFDFPVRLRSSDAAE